MITILFFMLGVLLAGVSLLTYVLIKSLFRITVLEQKNYKEEFRINKKIDDIHINISTIKRELHDCDERIIKDYETQFKDLHNRMDDILDHLAEQVKYIQDNPIKNITDELEIIIRNTDSRFDKFDNKLEDTKNNTLRLTSNMIDEKVKKDIEELKFKFYELNNDNSKKLIKG